MAKKVRITEKQFRALFEEQIAINYDSPLSLAMASDKINEGLIKTYPFETMVRYVSEYFNIPSFYIHRYENNNVMCVAIDIPKNKTLQNRIERAMNLCGYFKSISMSLDSLDRAHYEPKFEEEEVDVGDFLYHITNAKHLDGNKKIGLCPYHKNTFFSFPSRIYFFKESTPFERIRQAAKSLYEFSKGEHNDGKYAILKIDVNKLPENVRFHVDPNMSNGLYTTSNIPPSCIMDGVDMIDVLKYC